MKNRILDIMARAIIVISKLLVVLLAIFPLGFSIYQYVKFGNIESLAIMILTYGSLGWLFGFFWALWREDARTQER